MAVPAPRTGATVLLKETSKSSSVFIPTTIPVQTNSAAAEGFCYDAFWDTDVLISATWPRFTHCFQDTVLVYVPCAMFWLFLPFYVYDLAHKRRSPLPMSALTVSKMFLSFCLALFGIVLIVNDVGGDQSTSPAGYVAIVARTLTFVAIGLLTVYERKHHSNSSGLATVVLVSFGLCDIVPLCDVFMTKEYDDDWTKFSAVVASYVFEVCFFLLCCVADNKGIGPYDPRTSPEVTASFMNQCFLFWITRTIYRGWRKELAEGDLFDLNPRDACKSLVPVFDKTWASEVERTRQKRIQEEYKTSSHDFSMLHLSHSKSFGEEEQPLIGSFEDKSRDYGIKDSAYEKSKGKQARPSLVRVLVHIVSPQLLIGFAQKVVSDAFLLTSPYWMSLLISNADNDDETAAWKGYSLTAMLFLTQVFKSILFNLSFWSSQITGIHLKTILIAAVYKKALTMNNEAKKDSTAGEIVNLMSLDCQRIEDMMNFFFYAWTTPIQIIAIVTILYQYVNVAVFAGLATILLTAPFNTFIAGIQQKLQRENLKWKDERLRLANEALSGIKVIKLYAWEKAFEENIGEIRSREIKVLYKIAVTKAMISVVVYMAPFLVTLATLGLYVNLSEENYLDANTTFVTLSYFSLLMTPLQLLAAIISMTVQAKVSIERINSFLCSSDLNPHNVTKTSDTVYAVTIDNGNFAWEANTAPVIRNLSLKVRRGKVIAVVGSVGSGKSSLMSAILGEMEKISGRVSVNGSVAYVPQQAWIQNATVRDNILFGKPFKRQKYEKVIQACALERDLEILRAGDMTEIGEKGINLSGGQKQRVSLARAVYNKADIYILDDPLSAVDSHVGKHIFNHVISRNGILRNKTRILVTHGTHWLPMVDKVVVIVDGQISETGSYEYLMAQNGAFANLIRTFQQAGETSQGNQQPSGDEQAVYTDTASGDEVQQPQCRRALRYLSWSSVSCDEQSIARSPVTVYEDAGEEANDRSAGRLVQAEGMEKGGVKLSVFAKYLKSAGPCSIIISFVWYATHHILSALANFWLTSWSEDATLNNMSLRGTSEYDNRQDFYLGIYGVYGIAQVTACCMLPFLELETGTPSFISHQMEIAEMLYTRKYFDILYGFVLSNKAVICLMFHNGILWIRLVMAAKRLHISMLASIFRSPMSFFDTTPLGRIMNRCSRDLEVVDNNLPMNVKDLSTCISTNLVIMVVISINTPLFVAVAIPIFIVFLFIQGFFIPTSRQLKRIESVTRSPIYTHFSETISGGPTIRSYEASDRFITELHHRLDHNLSFCQITLATNRWLGISLELLADFVVLGSALFSIITPGISGATIGLSVSYANQLSMSLVYMVRQISELQTNIVSVERLKEYSELPSEAEWIVPNRRPAPRWPQHGEVELKHYMTRYRPGLDLVLRGITCKLCAGEKIGIVGRTGAGKSSLALALFRLIEASDGGIFVDGAQISDFGLHDVRSRLTILPQDPILFFGTLRMNLDPVGQHSDDQLWKALASAHLKEFVNGLPQCLDYQVGEEGQSLSVGQRQLVCLARALLKKTKILILDEATAAVDMETDQLIQDTIRSEFDQCTIITIAHRLNTIMDYDRIMVLDDGLIKELDTPINLLSDPTTVFYSMAKEANLV